MYGVSEKSFKKHDAALIIWYTARELLVGKAAIICKSSTTVK